MPKGWAGMPETGCRASLRTAGVHGGVRPQPDGFNHFLDVATVVGVMPFSELASWLCPIRLTLPGPARGNGCDRRAGRSYGRNAKLVFGAAVVVDGSDAGLYLRQEHRVHGPRRAPVRSDVSRNDDRSV